MAVWLVRSDEDGNSTMRVVFSGPERETPIRLEMDRHLLRRTPKIRQGDQVVFAREVQGDLGFYGVAGVRLVALAEEASVDRLGRTPPTIVEFGPFEPFAKERLLSVFALTLTVVRNVKEPRRHFRRSIRLLGPRDLQTLRAGEIYVARTAFYTLHAALPSRVRDDFERFARSRQISLSSPHTGDRARFDALAEYLRAELGPKLRLLVAAQHAYERIDCVGKPAYETLTSEAGSDDAGVLFRRLIGRPTAAAVRAIEQEHTLDLVVNIGASDGRFEEAQWTPLI